MTTAAERVTAFLDQNDEQGPREIVHFNPHGVRLVMEDLRTILQELEDYQTQISDIQDALKTGGNFNNPTALMVCNLVSMCDDLGEKNERLTQERDELVAALKDQETAWENALELNIIQESQRSNAKNVLRNVRTILAKINGEHGDKEAKPVVDKPKPREPGHCQYSNDYCGDSHCESCGYWEA